jgi:methylmalonyl-CoA mutase N-terminal domain/subunit
VKSERDATRVEKALADVRRAAQGTDNLVPPIIESAKAYATQQEICDVLREVFGSHRDTAAF